MKNQMRKIYLVLVIFYIFFTRIFSQIKNDTINFTLKGEIIGTDNGSISLSYRSFSNYKSDTAQIKDGKFVLNKLCMS